MTLADRIREHVLNQHIRPARTQGRATVTIRAAEVHAALGLEKRYPAVCGAVDTDKFLEMARVTLARRAGPRQSSTVEWVFALN